MHVVDDCCTYQVTLLLLFQHFFHIKRFRFLFWRISYLSSTPALDKLSHHILRYLSFLDYQSPRKLFKLLNWLAKPELLLKHFLVSLKLELTNLPFKNPLFVLFNILFFVLDHLYRLLISPVNSDCIVWLFRKIFFVTIFFVTNSFRCH